MSADWQSALSEAELFLKQIRSVLSSASHRLIMMLGLNWEHSERQIKKLLKQLKAFNLEAEKPQIEKANSNNRNMWHPYLSMLVKGGPSVCAAIVYWQLETMIRIVLTEKVKIKSKS